MTSEEDARYEIMEVWADGNPELYASYETAEEALRVRDWIREDRGYVKIPHVYVLDREEYDRGELEEDNLREEERF